MPVGVPNYDPRVIERFAENLYRKASAFVAGSVVVGAALGSAFGAVPLTSLAAGWPIPQSFGFATLLLGGLLGAVIGYVIGDARSFGYRLQAQSALCQVQLERNTAEAARTLTSLLAGVPSRQPTAAAAAPQPAVAAQPRVEPAPDSPQPPAASPPRFAPEPVGTGVAPPLTPPVSS